MYKEGKAEIKYTKEAFLNEHAELPRDISIALVSKLAEKKSTIIDVTAATGIRGIRYYLESPSRNITLLDMNKDAFSSMKKNLAANKVKAAALNESIQQFANTTGEKFDFIDLDPFGGVTPYIYDIMKISRGGTVLMVTTTDSAVLCGADYRACIRLYDAKPMHNELCHEVGMRILIGYVARIAAQFNFGVEVLLSFSYMHYMRVFIKLKHGSNDAVNSVKSLGYAHYCNKCLYRGMEKGALPIVTNCPLCKNALDSAGKMWTGSLYNKDLVDKIIPDMEKGVAKGMYKESSLEFLKHISEEADIPLYYSIPKITQKLKIGAVSPKLLVDKLAKKGFIASKTHLDKSAIKTDADIDVLKKLIVGK